MASVLVVDDEESICWSVERALAEEGHDVVAASSAEEALELSAQRSPDLILLDVRLPGADGLTALSRLQSRNPECRVVVMTAFGSLNVTVEAFEKGAVDFLPKPFDIEDLCDVVTRCLARRETAIEASDSGDFDWESLDEPLLGASLAMQRVFKQIALAAASDSPVLVTGESGVGKELVARAIHKYSKQSSHPFVPVNLAALSPSLIESELFGHARGAFTGAERDRLGILELADRGTIFLDEIGDVPLGTQVKLLRVLERQEFLPVGSAEGRSVNVRIVAATNRDLEQDVASKTFREDLFYRLDVLRIHVPPLRDRLEDIPQLARFFVQRHTSRATRPLLTEAALEELCRRNWRGNVRELRNALDTAAVVARGALIDAGHLPAAKSFDESQDREPQLESQIRSLVEAWAREHLQPGGEPRHLLSKLLNIVEPSLLEAVLRSHEGNKQQAAASLGLHRATLRKKLADYQVGKEWSSES